MIRRYAAQFLYVSGVGFIRRQVVELENDVVVRISPLLCELENTEWLTGILALLPPFAEWGENEGWSAGDSLAPVVETLPEDWHDRVVALKLYWLSPFNLTARKPVSGTRRKLLQ